MISLCTLQNVAEVMFEKGSLKAQRLLIAAKLNTPDVVEELSRQLWLRIWSRVSVCECVCVCVGGWVGGWVSACVGGWVSACVGGWVSVCACLATSGECICVHVRVKLYLDLHPRMRTSQLMRVWRRHASRRDFPGRKLLNWLEWSPKITSKKSWKSQLKRLWTWEWVCRLLAIPPHLVVHGIWIENAFQWVSTTCTWFFSNTRHSVLHSLWLTWTEKRRPSLEVTEWNCWLISLVSCIILP